jgi:cysteine desulfurase
MIAPDKVIYLDNNATTQVDPAVLEEMLPFLSRYYGNPSSAHAFGSQVRDAVELARERVAALVGCAAAEIVFTSCGTESSNSAINAALRSEPAGKHVVTSAVEHSATLRYCEQLEKRGCAVTFLGVDGSGRLDPRALGAAISPETALVTLMWGNNETGVLFPMQEIAELTRSRRVPLHVDAVQAAGKIPLRVSDLPINFCSISAHKLHGPKGIGALYVNRRSTFAPTLIGGGQENGRRAGTENVASIVGFGKAAELAARVMETEQARVRALRDRFESTLLATAPDTQVNGDREARLPNTCSLSFGGIEADAALILLDQHGVCCSAGSACRSGSLEPSHVLSAMKLPEERIRGSLRFSLGRFNNDAEIGRALEIIPRVISKLRGMSANPARASIGAVS